MGTMCTKTAVIQLSGNSCLGKREHGNHKDPFNVEVVRWLVNIPLVIFATLARYCCELRSTCKL